MTHNNMDFGKALRVSRAISGMQQKDLAKKSGFDASYISLVEKGLRQPSPKAIRAFTQAFEMPDSLFRFLAMEPTDTDLANAEELEGLGVELTKILMTSRGDGSQTTANS